MKITHKIYLVVVGGIIAISSILIINAYTTLLEVKERETLLRLKGVANSLSATVDPVDIAYLLQNYQTKNSIQSTAQDSVYQELHELFSKIEKLNNLGTPIYTLTRVNGNQAYVFGVTSSDNPYFRHEYTDYPKELDEFYHTGGVIHKYGDSNGEWLSAFMPVKSRYGQTLCVIQVDERFDAFHLEALDEIKKELSIAAIVTIAVILILWGILKKLITSEERYTKKLADMVDLRTNEVQEQKDQVEHLLHREKDYTQELLASQEELKQQTEELAATNDHLKTAQGKLVQNEKMASLGQMTAGIAHEINNPLNFIIGGVQSIRLNFTDLMNVIDAYEHLEVLPDEESKAVIRKEIVALKEEIDYSSLKRDILDLLNDVELGTDKVTNIIKSLKNFSLADQNKLVLANIHEIIDSTMLLFKSKLPDSIAFSACYDDTVPQVQCYPSQLHQVFLHLIENSIEALEGNGALKIATQRLENHVEIQISDNGPGIPKEIQSKIFDPFFTTKESGKGTGMGLSVTNGIIQKHAGQLKLQSVETEGTTFKITLPFFQN